MQVVDRNGFTETIGNKERLGMYKDTDFLSAQPFQKVLRVYGKDAQGQTRSKITSYHDNGELCQYLEAINGRANGEYQEWHPNGRLKVTAHLVEGVADLTDLAQSSWVFDGPSEVWDEEGHLIATFEYEKGLLKGTGRTFFPSGALCCEMPYQQGELHGLYTERRESGELAEETSYEKGEKQGLSRTYWETGAIRSDELFERGKLKEANYFDPAGSSVAVVVEGKGKSALFEGKLVHTMYTVTEGIFEGEVRTFYPNGVVHTLYPLHGGQKEGTEWEYYPSGEPKISLEWHEDAIQGQVSTWYPSGQKESQREVHKNYKQGTAFAWYKSGDLMLIEEYENDQLIKGSYYKKGDKKPISKIESGKGIATLYTPEGVFSKKVTYERGRPQLGGSA
jgi:antitoxin component YwqK of YwqJK toxin-antitoxin module